MSAILGVGSCTAAVKATVGGMVGTTQVTIRGFFASATPVPNLSVYQPDGVAIGDFNGDGIPDLATTMLLSGSIEISLGTGAGTFAASRLVVVVPGATGRPVIGDTNSGKLLDGIMTIH